jgi:hypothetical protein
VATTPQGRAGLATAVAAAVVVVVANVFGVPWRAVELVVERATPVVVGRATRVVGEPERPDGPPPQAAKHTARAMVAPQEAPARAEAERPVRAPVVVSPTAGV